MQRRLFNIIFLFRTKFNSDVKSSLVIFPFAIAVIVALVECSLTWLNILDILNPVQQWQLTQSNYNLFLDPDVHVRRSKNTHTPLHNSILVTNAAFFKFCELHWSESAPWPQLGRVGPFNWALAVTVSCFGSPLPQIGRTWEGRRENWDPRSKIGRGPQRRTKEGQKQCWLRQKKPKFHGSIGAKVEAGAI